MGGCSRRSGERKEFTKVRRGVTEMMRSFQGGLKRQQQRERSFVMRWEQDE
jgi:hypothetical protein